MAIDWSKIKHFTAAEFGAHADKLDERLIYALEELRSKLGTPMIITSAYRPFGTGYHPKGQAVDFVLPQWQKTAYEAYQVVNSVRALKGIGLYPNFSYGGGRIFGFHVDVRDKPTRWIGLGNSQANAEYVLFSNDNLKKYGLMK